jgi:hypothetical protein
LLLIGVFVVGCQKNGSQPLPGQSEVPPPEESTSDGEQACQGIAAQGSTLFASKAGGWGIVLPGEGWQLSCRSAEQGSGKLVSNRAESLLVTVTRVDGAPAQVPEHLDAIYTRAASLLPQAGAKPGQPKIIIAQATPKSPEKQVLVYQVHAAELEKAKLKSYHGWSIMRTGYGEVYECHLSATIRKDIDWAQTLSKYLSSCLPVVAR